MKKDKDKTVLLSRRKRVEEEAEEVDDDAAAAAAAGEQNEGDEKKEEDEEEMRQKRTRKKGERGGRGLMKRGTHLGGRLKRGEAPRAGPFWRGPSFQQRCHQCRMPVRLKPPPPTQ